MTQPTHIEEKYSEIDHYHCWLRKNPPCGQKIEHYKCCLCEKLNPKIRLDFDSYKQELFIKGYGAGYDTLIDWNLLEEDEKQRLLNLINEE